MDEKKIAFSFSKIKKPLTPSTGSNGNKNSTVKFAFDGIKTNKKKNESEDEEIDLITEISDKKVKSTKPREEKKVPIIELKGSKRSAEDMDAIKELIQEATNKKHSKKDSSNLKIESLKKEEEEEVAEDPDYEKVGLEDFGLACLRGMGWNDKDGIGKTNKQITQTKDVELRPRGLGLGASFNSKKKNDKDSDVDDKLVYAKGAYLEILDGKHSKKYAQLISFDDGLNRITVKLLDDEQQTISILQSSTKLVSKSKINSSKK